MRNFIQILPVEADIPWRRKNGRTDRHDEANSSFSQFCKGA